MIVLLVPFFMILLVIVSPLMFLSNAADHDERLKKAEELAWTVAKYAILAAVTWSACANL